MSTQHASGFDAFDVPGRGAVDQILSAADQVAANAAAVTAVTAVRDLHRPWHQKLCIECAAPWPCPTIQAIDNARPPSPPRETFPPTGWKPGDPTPANPAEARIR